MPRSGRFTPPETCSDNSTTGAGACSIMDLPSTFGNHPPNLRRVRPPCSNAISPASARRVFTASRTSNGRGRRARRPWSASTGSRATPVISTPSPRLWKITASSARTWPDAGAADRCRTPPDYRFPDFIADCVALIARLDVEQRRLARHVDGGADRHHARGPARQSDRQAGAQRRRRLRRRGGTSIASAPISAMIRRSIRSRRWKPRCERITCLTVR